VIEGTPEVLNDISGDGNGVERGDPEGAENLRFMSSLRIFIGHDRVSVCVPGFFDKFPFKLNEVLLGPLNFYANKNDSAVWT
jgi:hypothetical protein